MSLKLSTKTQVVLIRIQTEKCREDTNSQSRSSYRKGKEVCGFLPKGHFIILSLISLFPLRFEIPEIFKYIYQVQQLF